MKIDQPGPRCYQSSSKFQTTEFALTLLPNAQLSRRLFGEIQFVILDIKASWPKFKQDPFGSSRLVGRQVVTSLKRTFARPQTAFALVASAAIVTSVIIAVFALERRIHPRVNDEPALDLVTELDFASPSEAQDGKGIGAGEKGRVGFARGGGEGSLRQPARSQGGGGGGDHSQLAASQGRPPVPSIIPALIPTAAVHLPQALPVAGIDLDPALYRKLDYSTYGDPGSKQTIASNGSGDGGGVGSGKGTGIGEGDGAGFGPGRDGNIGGDAKGLGSGGGGGPGCGRGLRPGSGGGLGPGYGCTSTDQVFKVRDVATRPRVISKPEPQYTEQARRNQVTGTVVLRVIFSSGGEVTNIQPVQKLSDGLTEKAIAAAKQIRFVPATREGRPVSTYMQLEYNFNLY